MATDLDLTNCDREPIHIPGLVQSFGAMLVFGSDWIVRRASENVGDFLGLDADALIEQPIAGVLEAEAVHAIRGRLQLAYGAGIVERLFRLKLTSNGRLFDIAVHVAGDEIILEFEPASGEDPANAPAMLRTMIGRVEAAPDFNGMVREAARQVRALTGFSRVMVYRFDDTGAGEVVGESVSSSQPSFLGHRYPASDIPKQARALYERNLMRLIADVNSTPARVLPAVDAAGRPLDLSMSVLRAVSPVHIEYLKNMGVGASMSISVLRDGRLWGLIACHNPEPLRPSFDRRSAAELFGQMFSYLLESRLRAEEARFEVRVREIQARISAGLAQGMVDWAQSEAVQDGVRELLGCDGLGVFFGGRAILAGATPTEEEFMALVRRLNRLPDRSVVARERIADLHPPAEDYVSRAAGMLAIPISRLPRDYLIGFRKEAIETVTWAGDPNKPASLGPNGVRLTPRKSFEAWEEVVSGRSAPWSSPELKAAEGLRMTLMEVVMQLTDLADAEREASDKRQQLLIGELNHRVRNILGLVRGVITQSSNSASSVNDLTSVLEGRVQSMARAHDQLTTRRWSAAPLRALIEAEVEAYVGPVPGRLTMVGPEVSLAPEACTAVTLVIHELTTNAAKHGALSTPSGRIEIRTEIDKDSGLHIIWSEIGGPPVKAPTRQGFGSTIIGEVIPFELMGDSRVDYLPTGVVADLRIPSSLAQRIESSEDAAPRPAAPPAAKLEGEVLLLEDNLFIAIDAEEMLRKLGAGSVTVTRTVEQALEAISRQTFAMALLDVNLGSETSLEVARKLIDIGVPFAFGTGYGDALQLPADLADATVLTKPYSLRSLRMSIDSLLP